MRKILIIAALAAAMISVSPLIGGIWPASADPTPTPTASPAGANGGGPTG